mmetsp:Transcript_17714/g.25877  ORF Transcript_17714/g.25877 Transcript_17714/m.25877 type:complete len:92 (-) Transcript_17714:354-629(-)
MWTGDASPRTGIFLLVSSVLLAGLSLTILFDLDVFGPQLASQLASHVHPNGVDIDMIVHINSIQILIPLMSVPYLVWLIVKYISHELYLSN